MPRTNSILDTDSWKKTFGALLTVTAEEQNILPDEVGARLDRMGSNARSGRRNARVSDWWRYRNAKRIPTPEQVIPLAEALRIPRQVLSVCAGYVDDIFERTYAIAIDKAFRWDLPARPIKAAFSLLFSLFPNERCVHIGNSGSLPFWMQGQNVRSNLDPDEGFQTGKNWNGIWLYPVRAARHLVAHHERPDIARVIWVGEPPTKPWTWYSVRALLQVDLASVAATKILQHKKLCIPKSSPLFEAQLSLHRKTLPLHIRIDQATEIVHYWADQLNEELATEVREHLHPWNERTITDQAARWVQGEKIMPLRPRRGEPAMVSREKYRWQKDGRPVDFWC